MFGITGGEAFVIGFIVVAILSARYWPRLGERVAILFFGSRDRRP